MVGAGNGRIPVNVFFACGAPKSGTTWLQRLLDAHPEVSCSGEGHFVERFSIPMAEVIRQYNRHMAVVAQQVYEGQPSYEQIDQAAFDDLVRGFILGRLTSRGVDPDVRWVGDKTPGNVLYLGQLQRLFPAARFISIVRDPRDVTVSRLEHAVRAGLPRTDADGQAEIVRRSAEEWVKSVDLFAAFAATQPQRVHGLRYEDLLDDPAGEARRLFGFLGVSVEPALLTRIAEATSFEAQSGRKPGVEDPRAFLRKGVAGDWRGRLDPPSARIVEEICGDLLFDYGYGAGGRPGAQIIQLRRG